MAKKWIATGCVLMALLIFGGCKNRQSKVLFSSNRSVEITVPASWNVDPVLHHSAEIQASNRVQGLFVIVLSEDKKDVPNMDLAAHSELTRNSLLKKSRVLKMSQPKEIKIGSDAAIQTEIVALVYGYQVTYLHTSLETQTRFHQIICWSSAPKFESSKNILQNIVRSFRERKS